MSKCQLIADSGAIAVVTPYDPTFVMELKRYIPANERRWDNPNKRWIVAPKHGKLLQDLCMANFNELPLIPSIANVKPTPKQTILDVRYIGTTKDRGGDERTAFGFSNGGWTVVFPEPVLRAWFDAPSDPSEQPTLYSVLGGQARRHR